MTEYPRYKRVLFCTDFSDNADGAFEYAFGVAKRDKSLLYILHVITDRADRAYIEGTVEGSYPEMAKELRKSTERGLAKNFHEHYAKNIEQVPFKIIMETGNAPHEIIRFAKENDIALIVMGTNGKKLGSVAEMVARMSSVPVFIIPSKERAYLNPDERPFFPTYAPM